MLENVLEKKAFPDYKNNKLKKSKNWDFSKGVSPWFWSKLGNFSIFFNIGKKAKKMSLKIFYKGKKLFQTLRATS